MDKDAFFSAVALKSGEFPVPGTDITITLRELSAGQRETLADECVGKGVHAVAAWAVALSCPDFGPDDVPRLMDDMNAEALMSLSAEVFALSGVAEGSAEEAKKD